MATAEEYEARLEVLKTLAITRLQISYECMLSRSAASEEQATEMCMSAMATTCYAIMANLGPKEATRIIGHTAWERMKANENAD